MYVGGNQCCLLPIHCRVELRVTYGENLARDESDEDEQREKKRMTHCLDGAHDPRPKGKLNDAETPEKVNPRRGVKVGKYLAGGGVGDMV